MTELIALATGVAVAITAGTVGCFVVWKRMAYFSDALGHSALLGIAMGLIAGLHTHIGIIFVCALFACLLMWLQHAKILATDTLLGVLAHGGLSMGMVAISLTQRGHDDHASEHDGHHDAHDDVDIHDYLFGNILDVTMTELWWISGGSAIALAILVKSWPSLVLMTMHEDLARAEGVNIPLMHGTLMVMMTIIVAVSVQVVGILLISSLLIIPTATARYITHSPHTMALAAALIGSVAVIMGIYASLTMKIASGPSIVIAAIVLFIIALTTNALTQNSRH